MKLIKNNQEAYMGWHDGRPIWDRGIDKLLATPFYVESRGNAMDVSIKKNYSDAPTITVEYSFDKTTWQSLGSTSSTALTINVPAGGKVWLRASTSGWSSSVINYNYIATSSPCNVGGNIMSLLYGSNFTRQCEFPDLTLTYAFNGLFKFWEQGAMGVGNIVDASKLLLPATTLTDYCYEDMFRNCQYLTTAPILPATTLARLCYCGMFWGCTSLTDAPSLPATTSTFGCYRNMFNGCTSLITAPTLPAITLTDWCYAQMFEGCRRLNYIKCLATDISAFRCTYDWVNSVASSGTFVKKAGASWTTGASGIPEGWTVVEE